MDPCALVFACCSFAINLKHVADRFCKDPDIVLHVNPRFKEKTVVRDSRLQAKWGEEERTQGTAPLQLGQYFQCMILAHDDCFKVRKVISSLSQLKFI